MWLPLAAAVPVWVWATLCMLGFVALTIATMALARIPTKYQPPPVAAPGREPQLAKPKRERDWQVVRVAPDQLTAEMLVDVLREAGVPAQVSPADAVSFMGTSALGCRVLVPKGRVEEAEALLDDRVRPERNGDS